jgi:hypothetical protein
MESPKPIRRTPPKNFGLLELIRAKREWDTQSDFLFKTKASPYLHAKNLKDYALKCHKNALMLFSSLFNAGRWRRFEQCHHSIFKFHAA